MDRVVIRASLIVLLVAGGLAGVNGQTRAPMERGVRQTFEGWQGISIGGSWGLPILPPVSGYATRTDYHELRR
jgi:hypothetical protein